MKLSLISLLPVFGLFTTTLASPVAQPVEVVKRQDYSAESALLADLINNVKGQTGAISTSLFPPPMSPPLDSCSHSQGTR